VIHGFLRARDDTFTKFDPPGSINLIQPTGINPEGAITGSYTDASGALHGFLRARDGTSPNSISLWLHRHRTHRHQPGRGDRGSSA
jgi:hypothetical protein